MTERFSLKSAVHLLLLDGSRLLLLRRQNTGYEDGNYGVIAGHLDGDEPVRSAVMREASEEVGIGVRAESLRFALVMHSTRRGEFPAESEVKEEYVHFSFTATEWDGTARNAEPHKCDELRWCELDSLPGNVVPYVRIAIDCYRNGVAFAEFGWTQ